MEGGEFNGWGWEAVKQPRAFDAGGATTYVHSDTLVDYLKFALQHAHLDAAYKAIFLRIVGRSVGNGAGSNETDIVHPGFDDDYHGGSCHVMYPLVAAAADLAPTVADELEEIYERHDLEYKLSTIRLRADMSAHFGGSPVHQGWVNLVYSPRHKATVDWALQYSGDYDTLIAMLPIMASSFRARFFNICKTNLGGHGQVTDVPSKTHSRMYTKHDDEHCEFTTEENEYGLQDGCLNLDVDRVGIESQTAEG